MGQDLTERWGDPQFPWNGGRVARGNLQRQVGIHPNYILATALDPRFKHLKGIDESQHEDIKDHLVGEMVKARKQKHSIEMLTKVNQCSEVVSSSVAAPAAAANKRRNMTKEKSSTGGMFARYAKTRYAAVPPTTSEVSDNIGFDVNEVRLESRQELERFISSPGLYMVKEDNENELEDPFAWWALKKTNFPNVWRLAKFYLGIPATSVNSERCFSFSNRLLSASRTCIQANTAEETFFVHRNLDLLPTSPKAKKTIKRKAESLLESSTIEIDD